MNPSPKVITGHLHQQNKGACDWGYQGFLAYGCQCYTVIADPKTLQVIQTVGPQKGFVNYVRWAEEDFHHMFATGSTYTLHVASADTSGTVVIWDVATGRARTVLEDEQSHALLLGMEWLKGNTDSHDLLMLLRAPDTLELWDAFSGTRLWQKTFSASITSFDLDPFDMERLVCLCETPRVLVCTDISAIKAPGDSYRSIQLVDPNPTVLSSSVRRRTSASSSSSLSKMASLATNILSAPEQLKRRSSAISEDDSDRLTSCVQIVFNPAHQHIVLLVFSTEIQMLDIEVDIVVSSIRLDKNAALFVKCIPCQNVDVLFCLHDNGSASLRVKRDRNLSSGKQHEDRFDLTYEPRCHSESLRLLRHCKVYGFTCQPASERQVALLLSDSRLIFIDVMATEFTKPRPSPMPAKINTSLADAIGGRHVMTHNIDCIHTEDKITLGMVMSGLVSGLISPVTVVVMMRSPTDGQGVGDLLAVGSDLGTVQLLNVYSGQVVSEYKLFNSPVRGIEEINSSSLLAYSFPDPPSYGNRKVRSEIVVLNTKSGRSSYVASNKEYTGAVAMARISPSRMYLVIVYKERSVELWNLKTLQLIRDDFVDTKMKSSIVTWYNLATTSTTKRTVVDDKGVSREIEERALMEQLFVASQSPDGSSLARINVSRGVIETSTNFDVTNIFPMEQKLDIQQIKWQGQILVVAGRAGQIYTVDGRKLKSVRSKAIERRGSEIQSLQFAPGHSSTWFFLQYKDCFYICELNTETLISELLLVSPPMSSDIVSICWTGPDSVALATEDGCIHLLELTQRGPKSPTIFDPSENDDFVHVKTPPVLTKTTSPVAKWRLSGVFSPALIEPKLASLLKFSLQTNIEPFNKDVDKFLDIMDREVVQYIRHPSTSMADRCIEVARLYGDEFDSEFWKLVNFVCMRRKKEAPKLDTDGKGTESLLDACEFNDVTPIGDMDISFLREKDNCLISSFGDTMPPDDFKTYASSKLALHNMRRGDMRVKEICSRRYILLNKVDMAVSVLMETDMEHDRFKNDCLKACLTSCVQQTNTSMSTIKLAATHLIAAGHLFDGVELLCLIDLRMDACKYLISYGKWSDAIWLAKTSLNQNERLQVIKRWAEHLLNTNRMNKALRLLLLEGQYTACLKVLCQQRYYNTAALFLQALVQQRLIEESPESGQIYQEFSKLLTVTGYKSAVERYIHMGKTSGENSLVDVS